MGDEEFFEGMYARGRSPWDLGAPHPALVEWAGARRALVVGCGFGADAEFVAGLGYATVGFDAAPTAIAGARSRFPASTVAYLVADLLAPPGGWTGAFDLVVENRTVQSLPRAARGEVVRRIAGFVAPGGTLLVVAGGLDDGVPAEDGGPPWPLTRPEWGLFADSGLHEAHFAEESHGGEFDSHRWVGEFQRPVA